MVFSRADKVLQKQAEWDTFVKDFEGKVLHVANAIVKNSGGSAQSFTPTETLLDALWFDDANDSDDMIVFEDGTQKLDARTKFYFKSDATIMFQDWLYINQVGNTWVTPTTSVYTQKLHVDRVLHEQVGKTIIGYVVHATIMQDNTMKAYIGAT